jgi:hypothetical protein
MFLHSTLEAAGTNPDSCTVSLDLPGLFKHPLRNKAIKHLLAAAQDLRPSRGAHNPRPLDRNYEIIRTAMQVVFHELGLAA